MNFTFPGKWMLNPQEVGRLDAKRRSVIIAKALDGIWPVGHACAVPAALPQRGTAQA